MKKTIAAAATAAFLIAGTGASSAADMAVKARPMAPPPVIVWSWTGFYFGGHIGAGWGTTESTITGFTVVPAFFPPATLNLPFSQTSTSGFLGGVQAGANFQAGWAVFGIQGDIAGADIKGTSPCFLVLGCKTKTDWLASVTGRIGAVVLDRGLVYAKGGAAWQNSTHTVTLPTFGGGGGFGGGAQDLTSREITHFGWTIGLGTEWMITPNWTAFVEYNYYEFEKKNYAFPLNLGPNAPFAVTVNADLRNTLSTAKVGVNYKFNWGGGPVVARY